MWCDMAEVWYISGPMTGYPAYNFPAFTAAAARLRAEGKTVVSPHELEGEGEDHDWAWYLRRDLAALVENCTHVYALKGWEDSRGAQLEIHVARALGMPVVEED